MASNIHNDSEATEDLDFLDAVNNIEAEHCQKGFHHGSNIQKEKLSREGFQLGLSKGFEIGNEIGFYQAFAQTWLVIATTKEKKVLQQLLKLTQEFPEHNSKEDTVVELKQALNAKFKQACAVLKLDTKSETKDTTW